MKKYFVYTLLLTTIPAYSACPIDPISGESVCTLPSFREQVSPVFNNNSSTNLNNPAGKLQPLSRQDPINQMRGPNNDLNYNSGCQFGVCLQNPNKSRLPDQGGID